jgi:hypothetical protein
MNEMNIQQNPTSKIQKSWIFGFKLDIIWIFVGLLDWM